MQYINISYMHVLSIVSDDPEMVLGPLTQASEELQLLEVGDSPEF